MPIELAAASGFPVTPILAQAAQLPGAVTAHIAKSHVGNVMQLPNVGCMLATALATLAPKKHRCQHIVNPLDPCADVEKSTHFSTLLFSCLQKEHKCQHTSGLSPNPSADVKNGPKVSTPGV